jgi:hypothetical protein
MKVTYTIIVCCCVAAVAFVLANNATQAKAQQETAAPTASTERDEEPTELSKFMRQKLSASNEILEGLVTDDLTKVDLGAEKLLEMSKAEHWRASNDMIYMNHSREFRRSVETMQNKAKKKSIDGAALAWIDVTMNCIRCHEWVRDTILVDLSPGTGVDVLVDGPNARETHRR